MAQNKEEIVLNVRSDIGKVVKQTEKLDKATKKGKQGFKGIGTAVKGVGMALKAAGIGIIVALFAKLMEVFSSNQKVLDTFNTAMTAISMAFNDLFNFLGNNIDTVSGYMTELFENPQESMKEFGDSFKKNIEERVTSYIDTLGIMARAVKQFFDGEFAEAWETTKDAGKEYIDVFTGIDGSYEKLGETIVNVTTAVVDYTKKTWNSAAAVTEMDKAAAKAGVEFERLNAKYLKAAEVQRQIRDDETKTFAERIAANKELDKILAEQQKLQKEQIQTQIDAAQAQYNINQNDENWIALEKEKVAMLQLEETITGQLSEQKTNAVALEKELLQSQKELRAEGMSGLERELQELKTAYELKKEMARKAGEDSAAITEQYEAQKTEIIKANTEEQREAQRELSVYKAELLKQGIDVVAKMMEVQSVQIEKDYDKEIKLAEANGDDLEDIEKKFEGKRREQAKKTKAMKIAMALVDTYQSAVSAYAAGLGVGGPAGLVLGPVSAGLAVAAGLANVAMIEKQPLGGGGGGGGGTAAGGGANTPAPQMMSGAFELSGGVEPEPTKAYVVTDEMTNSQNQLANIRRRATI